jgi:predicted transcriptional regulator
MLPRLDEISKRRRVLGLSQKHLAHLAGVSQSMIAKIEAGKTGRRSHVQETSCNPKLLE